MKQTQDEELLERMAEILQKHSSGKVSFLPSTQLVCPFTFAGCDATCEFGVAVFKGAISFSFAHATAFYTTQALYTKTLDAERLLKTLIKELTAEVVQHGNTNSFKPNWGWAPAC